MQDNQVLLSRRRVMAAGALGCGVMAVAGPLRAAKADNAALVAAVSAAERAFARSMAERNLKAFATFVATDAVFIGGKQVLRGRAAVVAGWKAYFEGATAPFSWAPEQVEVLDSGTLAYSTGPVLNARGERTGTFKSTWRRDRDGQWRVAIDSGCPGCNCTTSGSAGQ